jgi:hypothetical protein
MHPGEDLAQADPTTAVLRVTGSMQGTLQTPPTDVRPPQHCDWVPAPPGPTHAPQVLLPRQTPLQHSLFVLQVAPLETQHSVLPAWPWHVAFGLQHAATPGVQEV